MDCSFVGLIGVMIMIRPRGEIFNAASLLPLVAALAYALVHIMTRKMSQTEQASAMAFYIQMNFVVVSFLIGLFLVTANLRTLLLQHWTFSSEPGCFLPCRTC